MPDKPEFDVPDLSGPEPKGSVRRHCVDCGAPSPPVETNFTLISARFGWRLRRVELPSGKKVAEWRCPQCWELFKGRSSAPRNGLPKKRSLS